MASKAKKKIKDENYVIKQLIEKLTHSGNDTLHQEQLKELKTFCSISDSNVDIVYNELMKLLEKNHSEVRLSTVQVCHHLLINNETFRKQFVDRMRIFLKHTIDAELPPPKLAAKKLLKLVITLIDEWNTKFGNNFYKINAAYRYLRDIKNVDFEIKEIVDPKKRKEEKEKEERALMLNRELLKKASAEMQEMKREIEETMQSIETCFAMLLPTPDEFCADQPEVKEEENSDDFEMRLFGVIDGRHNVQIVFDCDEKIEIKENEDNSAILEATKDAYSIINNRFLPKTKAWVELLRKVNDRSESGVTEMKQALVQEHKLNQLVNKYNILKIIPKKDQIDDDEVSSDSDLEEVQLPKLDKLTKQREEIGFLSELLINNSESTKSNSESETNDKGNPDEDVVSKDEERNVNQDQMAERKKELLKLAPKLPYDIDLYHWEDEKLPTPTVVAVNCEGANFWTASSSDDISELPIPGGSSVLRTRVIEFTGKFEPINRACRVPLPSGKLCPRKDRIKCPFHGVIVDRDEEGNIIKDEDKQKITSLPKKPVIPEWQDPKLLAEIKAKTGMDLKMPEKGKRAKRIKHPGLTDLNAAKKTAKARLSKKIFNKASQKRVAAVLNSIDHRKHRDKFGDQFNYMHGTC